jgi:putative ATP-dependent endonuclease of OLD family
MKIKSIQIENFRLLKSMVLDLEDDLSLVLGKNNTGKTSILTVLDKFINQSENRKIQAEDFNLSYKEEIKKLVLDAIELPEDEYNEKIVGIKLRLIISYSDSDDFENISKIMMDLDPNNNYVVLGYDYSMHFNKYQKIRFDFKDFKSKYILKLKEKSSLSDEPSIDESKLFNDFFKTFQEDYFSIKRKSITYDYMHGILVEDNFIDLDSSTNHVNLKNILNFKYISARREVTNKEADKTLSSQTSQIYERSEKNEEDVISINEFKDALIETDRSLTEVYGSLFANIVKKVEKFGGIKTGESIIQVVSSLQRRELLKGNTTVIYKHDDLNDLPEFYNGLGYMNLISMIFEIEILLQEFKKNKDENPADINLLFIEEPEAHTHPQMQYVFIENIKSLLEDGIKRKDGNDRMLQYVITTHSSHIVSNCKDFNAIKYLKKESTNSIISKNLRDLEKEYDEAGEDKNFSFLKQYLTLNRAELFFADKAILIEGDTERILIPAMMRKVDLEMPSRMNELDLLSQNISIVEVGAYSHIFEKFIDFIGIKSLIITDIDSYYKETIDDGKGGTKEREIKCPASDPKATHTRNYSLAYFHKGNVELSYYKKINIDWKVIRKNKKKAWNSNRKGKLLVIFQIKENNYHARSFEDSFFNINNKFICNEDNNFDSLTQKWLTEFKADEDSFKLSENGVSSKPKLAIEILINSQADASGNEFSNWQIPAYIKEGLLWLRKD